MTGRFPLALMLTATPLAAQEELSVALDRTPDTDHVDLRRARAMRRSDEAGLDVEIPPDADTSSGTLAASSAAELGLLSAIGFLTWHAAGADPVATFAVVRHETSRLVFDTGRKDIETRATSTG